MIDAPMFGGGMTPLDWLWIAVVSAWLLWLPGVAILQQCSGRLPRDPLVRLALEIALGMGWWVVVLLWTSTIGWRWDGVSARLFMGVCGLPGVYLLVRSVRTRRLVRPRRQWLLWLWLGVAVAVVATRVLHVKDLVLPAWIDAVHHTMITHLIVGQGSVPTTYAPFILGSSGIYHWGFHALAAWAVWLAGVQADAVKTAQVLLLLGQILNIAYVAALYAAARTALHSRRAGIYSALFGTLILWFPAYYTSWGRYPQLAALLLAIGFVVAWWQGRRRPLTYAVIPALLLAGLIVTHVRTLALVATFCLPLTLWAILRREWGALRMGGVAGALGALLALPWLATLASSPITNALAFVPDANQKLWWLEQNAVPWSLVWAPGVRPTLAIATAGLSVWLDGQPETWWMLLGAVGWSGATCAALWVWWRRHGGWSVAAIGPWLSLLCGWVLLTVLLANLATLQLPALGFLNNNSIVIASFVPLSLAAGGVFAFVAGLLTPRSRTMLVSVVLVCALTIGGAYNMRQIINPATILAGAADLAAFAWIRQQTPADAVFGSITRRWIGNAYVGVDGGSWLALLADRTSVVPPAIYTLVTPPAEVQKVNEVLHILSGPEALAAKATLSRLKEAGITHLYFGAAAHWPLVARLVEEDAVDVLYHEASVTIVRLR